MRAGGCRLYLKYKNLQIKLKSTRWEEDAIQGGASSQVSQVWQVGLCQWGETSRWQIFEYISIYISILRQAKSYQVGLCQWGEACRWKILDRSVFFQGWPDLEYFKQNHINQVSQFCGIAVVWSQSSVACVKPCVWPNSKCKGVRASLHEQIVDGSGSCKSETKNLLRKVWQVWSLG